MNEGVVQSRLETFLLAALGEEGHLRAELYRGSAQEATESRAQEDVVDDRRRVIGEKVRGWVPDGAVSGERERCGSEWVVIEVGNNAQGGGTGHIGRAVIRLVIGTAVSDKRQGHTGEGDQW